MKDIVACYVVANEAEHIAESIRSVKAYVDRFVIVDSLFETNPLPGTHSTDDTRRVAHTAAAGKPLDYIVSDERLDEPTARNLYLAASRGDWILVMDGDEQLYGDHARVLELFEDVRAEKIWDGVLLAVYTVAVNFNGNAPEMDELSYEVNPLISTRGEQARLLDNAAERGLTYRHTPLGIGHVAFDRHGLFASGDAPYRDEAFIINHHTRQSYEGYQRDYVWERAAIDAARR